MIILKLPTIFNNASNGKITQVDISVREECDISYVIIMSHGYVGGKQAVNERVITEGKNIGRANETTPKEQAIAEAKSRHQSKKDRGYREDINETSTIGNLPMLAHKYIDRGHKIIWPAIVQPKLNGVRCLATKVDDNTISYRSRRAKKYTTLKHLDKFLLEALEVGDIVDGEIFSRSLTFEEITSIVKCESEDKGRKKLEFWLYDFIPINNPDGGFHDRYMQLSEKFGDAYNRGNITLTMSFVAQDENDMKSFHKTFTYKRYEGTIIRNADSKYQFTHRSTDLQKYKDFIDDEFKIVGGKEGAGKDAGTIIFRCRMKDGTLFDVRPKGSLAQRKIYWQKLDTLIGKMLTVRYQNLSADKGVPIFPVGIGIRDYE